MLYRNDSQSIDELRKQLVADKLPAHVSIIMDGNGRWAESRGQERIFGHQRGADRVRKVVEISGDLGIKVLTLFAFSEENWGRPKAEVQALMSLLDSYILKERDELDDRNVVFRTIGDMSKLSLHSQHLIAETTERLSHNTGLILNIALSYGSRYEIASVCQQLAIEAAQGTLDPETIDAKTISHRLDTKGLPDPDLMIRTSGECRLSNFLLWQSAYTEFYFSQAHWPDFDERHFLLALSEFQNRRRRFGLVGEQAKNEISQLVDTSC